MAVGCAPVCNIRVGHEIKVRESLLVRGQHACKQRVISPVEKGRIMRRGTKTGGEGRKQEVRCEAK